MRTRRAVKVQSQLFERLESRCLLSGAQIDYANFSSLTGLVANGYGTAAKSSGTSLLLTDNVGSEARSVFYQSKVPVDVFTAHFSFTIVAGTHDADGLSFVIDSGATSDLGHGGADLAYAGGTFGAKSVDLQFNTFNNGSFGSTFAFAKGGNLPASRVSASPLDLHSGDTINATVTYDGTTLAITAVDPSNSHTYHASEAINLASVLGGEAAYVGFTGATGTDHSTQEINSFDFTGTPIAPTITTAAASVATRPTGTKSHLSVTAVSNDGGTLTYKWSVLHKPSGAATPKFSANGTAGANDVIAHYSKAGTYIFRCTVTDSDGATSVSDVLVVVKQTATSIRIEPHKTIISDTDGLARQQYKASVLDQFGHPLAVQPTITFAQVAGSGSINALTGLYTVTGSVKTSHLEFSATADGLTGLDGALLQT